MSSAFISYTFQAPAHWASALINGDTSGLEPDDLAELEAWVTANPEQAGEVVSCDGEAYITHWNGLQTEVLDYQALHHEPEYAIPETVKACWARHGERYFFRQLSSHAESYPLVYFNDREQCLCADCANSQEYGEPVTCGVHWEGDPAECDGCGAEVESAYGPVSS